MHLIKVKKETRYSNKSFMKQQQNLIGSNTKTPRKHINTETPIQQTNQQTEDNNNNNNNNTMTSTNNITK